MSEKDGGSAFPEIATRFTDEHHNDVTDVHSYGGMSLRDYFAAKAPQPDVHAHVKMIHSNNPAIDAAACGERMAVEFATWAYQFADAMIAERAK